jgi:hypothetical protein
LHLLPAGFHRMRHFGFLSNSHRRDRIALCRTLLGQPSPPGGQIPLQRNTTREVLRMPRLPAPHAQDRYSACRSASAIIFPVRHIMMPNTRCFQNCNGRTERSPSARYHASRPCRMGGHRCQGNRNSGQNARRIRHGPQSAGPKLITAIAEVAMPGVIAMPSDLLLP